MNNIYDLVIIGAGPAGLALAQMCSKLNKKILVIDREASIGGCHKVRRIHVEELGENMFSEHGPRIYSETYITFRKLLNDMNVDFYDLFTKYNFNITQIGGQTIFSILSFSEISSFILPFLYLTLNPDYGSNIILHDFIKDFDKNSIEIIDRTCILTDGGDSTKFTLNEFLQLLNQQFFYSLYQPKLPNDIGLFKIWKEYLLKNNVDFLLNTNIETVNMNKEKTSINSINIQGRNKPIMSKSFVFAIPPKNLNEIINKNNIKVTQDLNKYVKDTSYYDYISFTFHWKQSLNLKKIYGFPASDWGIAFIKLSDYMTFNEINSKTVISIALTRSENISKRIGKSANDCTFEEIYKDVYLELKKLYGDDLIEPTVCLLSPGVKYDSSLRKWISYDTAFINSAGHAPLDFKDQFIDNMYNLGTHNGKSLYKFTSLESAVSNSVCLSKILYPELNDIKYITVEKTMTLSQVLFIILLCSLVLYYVKYK